MTDPFTDCPVCRHRAACEAIRSIAVKPSVPWWFWASALSRFGVAVALLVCSFSVPVELRLLYCGVALVLIAVSRVDWPK